MIQLTENQKLVSSDELKNLHSRNGFILFTGDTITVEQTDKVSAETLIINGVEIKRKDANGVEEPVIVYKIGCTINGTDKLVPLGTFTKRPIKDLEAYCKDHPINKGLLECVDDFARFEFLKKVGKFKVSGFFDGETTNWNAETDPKTGNKPTRPTKFPLFEAL